MSRPLGAPGEFICMMDAHWVTLSRLLKKNSPLAQVSAQVPFFVERTGARFCCELGLGYNFV